MEAKNFSLVGNINGETYRELLNFSTEYCDTFVLVTQESLGLNKNAVEAIKALSPFLESSEDKMSWPGTELLLGTAKVNRYKLINESITIILSLSDSLYAWLQPNLPEDLALIRSDNIPLLSSVAHESEAIMTISKVEMDTIRKRIPDLKMESLDK